MMNAEIMREADQKRLAWRCRRGMLELDIVLQRFVGGQQFGALNLAELATFDEMLELADNDFWTLLNAPTNTIKNKELRKVIAQIKNAPNVSA